MQIYYKSVYFLHLVVKKSTFIKQSCLNKAQSLHCELLLWREFQHSPAERSSVVELVEVCDVALWSVVPALDPHSAIYLYGDAVRGYGIVETPHSRRVEAMLRYYLYAEVLA